jgi:DnaJ-class molecular chaperone
MAEIHHISGSKLSIECLRCGGSGKIEHVERINVATIASQNVTISVPGLKTLKTCPRCYGIGYMPIGEE